MTPSSPKRPCSALKATSGFSRASNSAASGPTSTRVTRNPSPSSALAQASPERREIGRSAESPPMSTATCFIVSFLFARRRRAPSVNSRGASTLRFRRRRPSFRMARELQRFPAAWRTIRADAAIPRQSRRPAPRRHPARKSSDPAAGIRRDARDRRDRTESCSTTDRHRTSSTASRDGRPTGHAGAASTDGRHRS